MPPRHERESYRRPDMPWVTVGPLPTLPKDRCLVIADGRAIVARHRDSVMAFVNRCLHENLPLEDARAAGGIMICPHHFWQYQLADGSTSDAPGRHLESFPVEVVDGIVYVDVPAGSESIAPAEPPSGPVPT